LNRYLKRLLGRPDSTSGTPGGTENVEQDSASPSLPSDRRLYCIGDIHGRLDLLKELHAMIMAEPVPTLPDY
jgi:hypothetical protein